MNTIQLLIPLLVKHLSEVRFHRLTWVRASKITHGEIQWSQAIGIIRIEHMDIGLFSLSYLPGGGKTDHRSQRHAQIRFIMHIGSCSYEAK